MPRLAASPLALRPALDATRARQVALTAHTAQAPARGPRELLMMPRFRSFPPSAFRLDRRVCSVRRARWLGLPCPPTLRPRALARCRPSRAASYALVPLWLVSHRVCLARRSCQSRPLCLLSRRHLALSRLPTRVRCSPPTRPRARLLTNPAPAARHPARAASSGSRRFGFAPRWPAFGSIHFAF